MDFIKQYLRVLSYMCTGIVFAFAAFYILANAFHYLELRKDYVTRYDELDIVSDINKNLDQAKKNINTYNPSTYTGTIPTVKMNLIKENINQCINTINNEKVKSMLPKTRITIIDVYELREAYENEFSGKCIVKNLQWLMQDNISEYNSPYLVKNQQLHKLYMGSLMSATSYLKKDLQNNSSYFYNTAIASQSVKDNTKDGFDEVMSAYNKASEFILYFSNWFKEEASA